MKKKNIINLIKYHVDNNESGFRSEAYEIANDFDAGGDYQLAEYIISLLSNLNTFVPQMSEGESPFFERVEKNNEGLWLPECITQDLLGIVHATAHNAGVNKFLFQGAPGTGKTEAVKQLARALNREIFMVNFSSIVDSKLGQTQKNIARLFEEIENFVQPDKIIVLFDEIDAIALDRTNENDIREMGRATTSVLKAMDRLNEQVVVIATTNLYDFFDKALLRRFDSIIDFSRYSKSDLMEIAEEFLNLYIVKFKLANKDIRIFRKIINLFDEVPYPGDLKNIIKTAIAFSDPEDGMDYFRRLYFNVVGKQPEDLKVLKKQGFTVREMEILSKVSRSSISRELREMSVNE